MRIDRGQYWGMYFLHIECPRRFAKALLGQIKRARQENKAWSGFRLLPPPVQVEHRQKACLDIYVPVTNCRCQFVATEVLLYGLKVSYIEIECRYPATDYRHGHEYLLLGGLYEAS